MNEKELREIADSGELEGRDIAWVYGIDYTKTGRVLFDYDQGLSIVEKDNTTNCLTAIHGPAYNSSESNYQRGDKESYHKTLTAAIKQLRDGVMNCEQHMIDINYFPAILGPPPTCSFS